MTITTQNVKIFKSEVIADTPDGGGRMTGNEVIDGELNNLFDDTSRIDRVNGRVSLRKCFGAVVTANTDKFLGAHFIITRPPLDGRVVATLLDLKDHADRRLDAKAFVEKYLIAGVENQLTLYSNQPIETRNIIAYQEFSDPIPAVGDVFCLSVEKITDPNFGKQQFVRVINVASVSITGNDGSAFTKRLLTMGISEALEITYPGIDLLRAPQPSSRPTRVRKAEINPVANFYGIVPMAEAVGLGDTALKVATILQAIVPSSYSETPLLDRQLGASIQSGIGAGPAITEIFTQTPVGGIVGLTLLRPAKPGSVTVTADASGADNDVTLVDAGGGVLTRSSGGVNTAGSSGTIAYTAGQLNLSGLPNASTTISVSYVPSVVISDVQNTAGITITLANRGFNYAQTLIPKPAPGAVVVNYRALGNWYALVDNGKGQLVGPAGTGAGTVNYLTGTVNVTVGYQPDVGSPVLFGWGTGVHYTESTASIDAALGAVNGSLAAGAGLVPSTVSITWGSPTKTATDNGQGLLTGDASGGVNYATGAVTLVPNALVDSGTVFSISASRKTVVVDDLTPTVSGGNVSFTLTEPPAEADTLFVAANYRRPTGEIVSVQFVERGGSFKQLEGTGANGSGLVGKGTLRGSVNITSGVCSLPEVLPGAYRRQSYASTIGNWQPSLENLSFEGLVDVRYVTANSSATSATTELNQTSLRVDFSAALNVGLVPGSLIFTLNGRRYYDFSGTLYYRDGTGAEIAAGLLDYLSGIGTITSWLPGAFTASVQTLLTKYGQFLMSSVIWRTEGEPIRSQSFQVTNGIFVTSATSANLLTSPQVNGSISLEDGVYSLTFTPAIIPETARYNAVALTYLPSDPEILGLNAVRLPLDGRVPVLRPGSTLVLLNDQTTTLPNPVVAGQTYALPRQLLAYAVVYDANGLKLPTDRYSATDAQLDAGEISFVTPLDLSGYVQPLTVEHRIEDMVRCIDAQLSGDVQISGDITHNYPVLGSYMASAKLYGDLQGRATAPFSQQAWTGVWSDAQIGAATNGQYNNTVYPMTTTNAGAITERWRIEFLSPTAFRLIGETVGQIATGDTSVTFAPVNPSTNAPYFTVPQQGWGAGWVAGNQVRLNTTAAAAAAWLLRCTLQGPESEPTDSFRIQFRGDN